jgi:nucleoside-diphosphate-sugar epimerase
LVDAVWLAVENERAVGQVYNLTDGEAVSKRRFIEAVADAMGLPHPHRRPPYWLAWLTTWCSETAAKLRGQKDPPAFNFTRLKFLGLNLDFSIDKARRDLGYRPRHSFADAMAETMDWYKKHYGSGGP